MSVKNFLVMVMAIAVMFEFIDDCKGQYECTHYNFDWCKQVSLA